MNPAHLSLRPGPVRWSSDQALARMAGAGSDAAFAELVARYERLLRGYVRTIVRQREDAEDVVQSTFLRALAALRDGTRPQRTKPWLYRIAHNEAISLLRGRREQSPLPEETSPLHPAGASAHDSAVASEELRTLVADVGSLPERQRTALVLHELCGMRYGDVAEVLQTDADNARLLAFEARGALKEAELGRSLPCEMVRDAWRDGGGRALRRRSLRAHVDGCGACADYVSTHRRRRGVIGWLGGLGALWPFAGSGGGGAATVAGGGMIAKVAGAAVAVVGTVGAIEAGPSLTRHTRRGPASASAIATPLPKASTRAATPSSRAASPLRAAAATVGQAGGAARPTLALTTGATPAVRLSTQVLGGSAGHRAKSTLGDEARPAGAGRGRPSGASAIDSSSGADDPPSSPSAPAEGDGASSPWSGGSGRPASSPQAESAQQARPAGTPGQAGSAPFGQQGGGTPARLPREGTRQPAQQGAPPAAAQGPSSSAAQGAPSSAAQSSWAQGAPSSADGAGAPPAGG